ncbi:MAG: methyltransferase [Planctomycetota bacterium]|nr:methyltransferase [Planctomycetota bacterium]
MTKHWTPDELSDLTRGFQLPAILFAAAELDVFTALAQQPQTAAALAHALGTDLRGLTILLDALAATDLLVKTGDRYAPAPGTERILTDGAPESMRAMTRHLAACNRSWSQLAQIVKTGRRADREPGVLGASGELEAFIEAMDDVSRHAAPPLVKALGNLGFTHLLDVGGGPGTWTIEFLKNAPAARATLFDLPDVIPIARKHLAAAGLIERCDFVGGDFDHDAALPAGADLAWVSAIIHMNSPVENRALYTKVHRALVPGGRILIRDLVMDSTRTRPIGGALFAVNMLANTPGGNTYTLEEISGDLVSAGFTNPSLLHHDPGMSCVVCATRP